MFFPVPVQEDLEREREKTRKLGDQNKAKYQLNEFVLFGFGMLCLGVVMGYLIKKRKFSNDDEDSQDDTKDKHSHDDDIDNGGVLNLESSVNEMNEIPALEVNDSNKT